LLAVAAFAAFTLGMPVGVLALTPERGLAEEKSTSSESHKHHKDAADEQKEMNKHIQKLTKSLKLTDEQVEKVKPILEAHMAAANELHAKYEGQPSTPESKAEMKKAHEDLHADTDAKLAQVLTADQMVKYKKMMAKRMKKEEAKEEKEEKEKEDKK
jgi:Spy/CpxP family protein refolding chaperone